MCLCLCEQVPVPNLPASVHEAGKSVEKADAIFSQERDPRFAEMFAGISACKFWNGTAAWRGCGMGVAAGPSGDRVGSQCPAGRTREHQDRSPSGASPLASPLPHLFPGALDHLPSDFEGRE